MVSKHKDISGQRFGRLVAVERDYSVESRKAHWICECDCGNKKTVRGDSLGKVNSCGCLKEEQDKANLTANHTHKMSGSKLYQAWTGMKQRCYNPNNQKYKNYGERGIRVCAEWKEDSNTFIEWALNNGFSENLTLDRIDVNGDYEPNNCRWITNQEQCENRTTNVLVSYNGDTITLKRYAQLTGKNYGTMVSRYQRGWSIEEVMNGRV